MEQVQFVSHTFEEQETFAAAARDSTRRQVAEMLAERDLALSGDLEPCPRCGERVILALQPGTWTRERVSSRRICSPCGTELSLLELMRPDAEIGGEG